MGIELINVDFDSIVGKECLNHVLSGDFSKALAVFELIKKDSKSLKDFNSEIEKSIKTQLKSPFTNINKLNNIKEFTKKLTSTPSISRTVPKRQPKLKPKNKPTSLTPLSPVMMDRYFTKEEQLDLFKRNAKVRKRVIESLNKDHVLSPLFQRYLRNTKLGIDNIILHRHTDKAKDRVKTGFKTIGGVKFIQCLNVIHALTVKNSKRLVTYEEFESEMHTYYGKAGNHEGTLKDTLRALAKSNVISFLTNLGTPQKYFIKIKNADFITFPKLPEKVVTKTISSKKNETAFLKEFKLTDPKANALRDKLIKNKDKLAITITLLERIDLNNFFEAYSELDRGITPNTLEKILHVIYMKCVGKKVYTTPEIAKILKCNVTTI